MFYIFIPTPAIRWLSLQKYDFFCIPAIAANGEFPDQTKKGTTRRWRPSCRKPWAYLYFSVRASLITPFQFIPKAKS